MLGARRSMRLVHQRLGIGAGNRVRSQPAVRLMDDMLNGLVQVEWSVDQDCTAFQLRSKGERGPTFVIPNTLYQKYFNGKLSGV